MSAATRLWRGAPLWRLTLACAVAFVALASLYPPAYLERVSRPLARTVGGTAGSGAAVAPAVALTPDFGTAVSRVAHVAGRSVPLPAGAWHPLVVFRDEHATEVDIEAFARVSGHHLTGLIFVSANVLPVDPPLRPSLPAGCFDSRSAFTGLPNADGQQSDDCWFATGVPIEPGVTVFRRLQELAIDVPPALVGGIWTGIDQTDFERVTLAVPGDGTDALRARAAFMRRWRPLLRRGFAGTLRPAEVPAGGLG